MAKRDRNKRPMRNDMGAVIVKGDYERYGMRRRNGEGGKKQLRGKRKEALIWRVYRGIVMEGRTMVDLAQELGFTELYIEALYRQGQKALASARNFNPEAEDIRREMKKFLPLAATALEENLQKAEPRVTVAYFQGIGAFVDKQEVVDVTETERQAQMTRAERAFNKRLMEKMKVNAEVTIDDGEDDAREGVRTDKRETAGAAGDGNGPASDVQSMPVEGEERQHGGSVAQTGGPGAGAEEDERTQTTAGTETKPDRPK